MRYIKRQLHKYTCGAIAVANAIKSKGIRVSYKDMIKLFGVDAWLFEEVRQCLDSHNLKYKIINPTFQKLEKELKMGRGIIVVNKVYNRKGCGHYYFLKGNPTKKYFKGFNFYNTPMAHNLISKRLMQKDFAYSYQHWRNHRKGYPKAIVLL